MVKKRRGAAEVEVRREVGEEQEEAAVEEVRREAVGSRWFWRWRRFDSIIRND